MAEDKLGVPARAAVLSLMAIGREAPNAELKPYLGDKGVAADVRRQLVTAGLIVSREEPRRRWHHALTTRGWEWCTAELSANKPARSGSMGGALYAVLNGLANHLSGHDLTARDLFEAAEATPDQATALVERADSDSDIEHAIRAGYRSLASKPNDWVKLADLRDVLPHRDRAAIDRVLVTMNRKTEVNLAPEPLQALLTDADRSAAVEVGGRPNHLIAIDER